MSATAGLQVPAALTTGGGDHNRTRAERLHGAMHALNMDLTQQVRAGTLTTDSARWRQWKRWIEGYGRWYGTAGEGFFSGWSARSVSAMLDSYDREMEEWRSWYGRTFRVSPTGRYAPPKPTGGADGAGLPKSIPAWAWAGITVAGLYAAAKLVHGLR